MSQTGFFLISLDTELAWGHYDSFPATGIPMDGLRERAVVKRLLGIFEYFGIAATWALVGHMFYVECEKCHLCPIQSWEGKYSAFEQIYGSNDPLWYGADIVDMIQASVPEHEIAFHGYTHRVFDESELSEQDARVEIEEWLRLSERKKIPPASVIFPRNTIGFLPLFKEKGFICYRGNDLSPRAFSFPYLGKLLKWLDIRLQFFSPEVYDVNAEPGKLVNLPSSRRLFGMNRIVSVILNRIGLNNFRMKRLLKGLENAAIQKRVFHVRTHPYEFRTERDFKELEMLLFAVADEIRKGRIQSVTMSKLTQLILHNVESEEHEREA